MPGFSDNPFSYMQRADAFVLCSAWKDFRRCSSRLCIWGRRSFQRRARAGLRKYWKAASGAGLFVGDAGALAQAIVETLRKPQRNLAVDYANKFSVDNIIREYADVLSILI